MLPLNPATAAPPVQPTTQVPVKPDANPAGENLFEKLLVHANEDQLRSEQAIGDLVTGKSDDVQQVVMQVAKSEMSFQLFMEVRNQVIESYNELMRMQF